MKVVFPAWAVSFLLVVGHVTLGLGYAVGPPRYFSSGSFAVAVLWAPQPVWGWALVAGGVLAGLAPMLPWWGSVTLHILASGPLLALSVALLAALEVAQGWGGFILFGLPVLGHAALSWTRYRYALEVRHA